MSTIVRTGANIDTRINNTFDRESRTSVALDTHTLVGLGGVDIIGRLSKIEIIIKKVLS